MFEKMQFSASNGKKRSRFVLRVSVARSLDSTAARVRKPAASQPRSRPPAPVNRLTPYMCSQTLRRRHDGKGRRTSGNRYGSMTPQSRGTKLEVGIRAHGHEDSRSELLV